MKFTKLTVEGGPPKFARHTSCIIGNKVYSFGGFDGISELFGLAILDLGT
jgi:hypothetical protein